MHDLVAALELDSLFHRASIARLLLAQCATMFSRLVVKAPSLTSFVIDDFIFFCDFSSQIFVFRSKVYIFPSRVPSFLKR